MPIGFIVRRTRVMSLTLSMQRGDPARLLSSCRCATPPCRKLSRRDNAERMARTGITRPKPHPQAEQMRVRLLEWSSGGYSRAAATHLRVWPA